MPSRENGKWAKACGPSTMASMPPPRRAAPPHGKDLPRQLVDVAEVDDPRLRRDGLAEHLHQVLHAGWRRLIGHLLEHDTFASDALVPRGEHPAVVLVRRQHLIARFEIEPILADLERFTGVPGDGHLLRITSEGPRETPAHTLDLRLEMAPHMVDRHLIRILEMAPERVLHHSPEILI